MQTYKATNDTNSYLKNFVDLAAAQNYYLPILGDKYTITLANANEQIPVKPARQKIKERKAFGASLEDEFLYDNAVIFATRGTPVTKTEARILKNKCKDAWDMAKVGSLEICIEELQGITLDTILTQERIDKYIASIQSFIINEQYAI